MSSKKIINVLETFAGIGAQHKAITKINKEKKIFEIVSTVEWDARANIAYGLIHNSLDKKLKKILKNNNLTSEEEINKFLLNFTISLDSKKPAKIISKDYEFKQLLAASIILSNNNVDITKLDPKIIQEKDIELITYSFPCQGLSIANMGRSKGINDDKSTSSLIWEIYRILKGASKKPKYLLMENVTNLLSKKFKPEYEKWLSVLEDFGYKTFTTTINSINAGSIQKRERVFALSVKKEIKTPFNDDKSFKEFVDNIAFKNKLSLNQRKKVFEKIFNFDLNYSENLDVLMNNTKSRIKMVKTQKIINKSENYIINTLTTVQDRIPCVGIIEHKNNLEHKLDYRYITPREAYKLMGFSDQDFNKLKPYYEKNILTKESLYRQAGNSIVVEAIENLFKVIKIIEKGQDNE
ncbi:DNA (cytosine-5-)-methyltransferase [Mycoplasma sp. 480]|uniref:DNA (cytosine-5-)-methyltransferase n=1 Tax=Mycoplasma sp. 480 TaxID=3440155 RepID=UPI003F50F480